MNPNEISIFPFFLRSAPADLRRARCLLSSEETERAARFRTEQLRDRYTLGRAAVRALLARELHAEPGALQFSYGERGKPALTPPSPLQFNLTHTGDLAVCALAWNVELGVDVEAVRPVHDMEGIAGRFFSAAEADELQSLPVGLRTPAFCRCWTRKEAFIKATGDGLSYPLDGFRVSLLPEEPCRMLEIARGDASAWALHAFEPVPGYMAAVCYRAPARTLLQADVTDAGDLIAGASGLVSPNHGV